MSCPLTVTAHQASCAPRRSFALCHCPFAFAFDLAFSGVLRFALTFFFAAGLLRAKARTKPEHAFNAFIVGFMIKLGYSLTEMVYYDEYAKTASLQIPEWYFYAVLPIMGVMMFVRTLIILIEDWFGIKLCEPPIEDEVA